MNGQTFLELKKSHIYVIMITSNPDFAASSYDDEEVVDYLTKPLSYGPGFESHAAGLCQEAW
ncbi:MAG: hypothetical protein IPI18_09945 [Saprospiraceae bacterium]|nr:hypothetical protein [Saprospiraceae bacterium]